MVKVGDIVQHYNPEDADPTMGTDGHFWRVVVVKQPFVHVVPFMFENSYDEPVRAMAIQFTRVVELIELIDLFKRLHAQVMNLGLLEQQLTVIERSASDG